MTAVFSQNLMPPGTARGGYEYSLVTWPQQPQPLATVER
jgi:hypothetical protein